MTTRKGSLFVHLTAIVSLTVIAVFSISTLVFYLDEREVLLDTHQQSINESTERLVKTIAPYIASYAVNDYESLVNAELQFKEFLAIVVNDEQMAKVLGRDSYVTGRIRNEQGEVVPYLDSSSIHHQHIDDAALATSAPIIDSGLGQIGSITIYVSDDNINQSLAHLFRQTIITSIITALSLIALLLYFTRRFFVTPLARIVSALGNRDKSGIPVSEIPDFSNRELSSLSGTMNNMIEMIRYSHDSVRVEHDRLQNVIESTQSGTWEWDVELGRTLYNGVWEDILGHSADDLIGPPNQDWKQFVHPEDKFRSDDELEKLFSQEIDYYDCEVRLRHESGQWRHALARGKVVDWDAHGRPLRVLGTVQNITLHKQAEESLRLAAKVFTHAREGIIITDAQTQIIEVNDAFCRITGYSLTDVKGKKPSILQSGQQGPEFYREMWRVLSKHGHWSGELWNRRKNGEIYPELLTISVVTDKDDTPLNYVAVFSDITAYKEHEHKLQKIAHYDPLTELPNRLLLMDRLQLAMKHAKRHQHYIAVIFLDLDGFKPVNDKFGHETGDILLQHLAQRLKTTLRESDTIARIGGDEFVAVLGDFATPEACHPLLPRLLEAACEPIEVGGHRIQVSASFGVTTFPQVEDVDSDMLLRQADYAMYQAKLKGKKRYHFFDAALERSLKTQHEYYHQISEALRLNQFFLAYQPKVNLRTGDVVGFEALIRWQHPDRGILSPIDFIPHIEHHSLINEVGDWVIDNALNQLAKWQKLGFHTQVSVNIAPYHILQPDFITKLRNHLARFPQLSPNQLEFEILETSALQDIEAVSKAINTGEKMGVSFAIDDFGTGYASLTYLKRLHAKTLKIDRSFVRGMLHDPEDLAILESIITLASTFARNVLAEGIETKEQVTLLLWMGCELGQGFGISRPIPADDVMFWAATWQPSPDWYETPTLNDTLRPLINIISENRARSERCRRCIQDGDITP